MDQKSFDSFIKEQEAKEYRSKLGKIKKYKLLKLEVVEAVVGQVEVQQAEDYHCLRSPKVISLYIVRSHACGRYKLNSMRCNFIGLSWSQMQSGIPRDI